MSCFLSHNFSSPAPQIPNVTTAAQFILNDTSLAALSLPNGDRQFFFQDSTGRIRRTGRTASNSQWNTSPDSNTSVTVPGNPKNHKPLALGVSVLEEVGTPESSTATAMTVLIRD